MNDPKRHHTNPEMLQSRFVNDRGNLYFFNKSQKDRGVLESSPKNLFVKGHLYSTVDKDGKRDASLEKFYSVIEGRANLVIEKIVLAARRGLLPGLTAEEKRQWDFYVYHQWRRAPDFYEQFRGLAEFKSMLESTIVEYERQYRPVTKEEREDFESPETLKRLRQNAGVGALAVVGDEAIEALGSRGLGIAIVRNPKKSFIIGSMPLVKLTSPGKTHLAHPDIELWFPISFDVAVTPFGARGNERLVNLTSEQVRTLNRLIARQSSMFAARSEELVASLAKEVG